MTNVVRLMLALCCLAAAMLLSSCGGGGGDRPFEFDDTTTITPVTSQYVSAGTGGSITVTNPASDIYGVKLAIPAGALPDSTTVSIGMVNNPPKLPAGYHYVGVPIDLGPDGTVMNTSLTLDIPYSDAALHDAGLDSDVGLTVFGFDTGAGDWQEADVIGIDTANNILRVAVSHFSYYALTGLNGTPPDDLGTPQPGDLLFMLCTLKTPSDGWRPGHVAIYTGETAYPGSGAATAAVKEKHLYNLIEASWEDGVRYAYCDLPNVTETYEADIPLFNEKDGSYGVYMGAREPKDGPLTQQQRLDVVAFAQEQIGTPYAVKQSLGVIFGMLGGDDVKGQKGVFNCVGLSEAAYEYAGVNDGEGLVAWEDEGLLTPAEQYNETQPAGGGPEGPTIAWASLDPNYGTPDTEVMLRVAVTHPYGLSFIDSVRYVTDTGYTNPDIYINDEGINGDLVAGDGIYTVVAYAGGDAGMGSFGLTVTVIDKAGKTDSAHLTYTYTGYSVKSPKETVRPGSKPSLPAFAR